MSEETTNSGTVEAAEQAEAPTLAENIEASSGAPPIQDEYEQRVEAILKHHEKTKAHNNAVAEQEQETKRRSYEDMKLQEGES